MIRGKDEIGDPASRPPTQYPTLTWHFTADSVRDFAWAAARHFVWDAVGVNGGKTLAMSFYPPSAEPLWKEATQYAKTAHRVLLEAVGALSLPLREQRERDRGRDGVSR